MGAPTSGGCTENSSRIDKGSVSTANLVLYPRIMTSVLYILVYNCVQL
jgi:hypothetical protein